MCSLLIDASIVADAATLTAHTGERALIAGPQLRDQIGVVPFWVFPLAALDQLAEVPLLEQLAVAENRHQLVFFGRDRVASHGLERPVHRAECEPALLRNLECGACRRLVNITPFAVDADGARL